MDAAAIGLFAGHHSHALGCDYLLVRANHSLVMLREALEGNHRILLRDCRSFEGLGDTWLRIGLQSRRNNRRIVRALREELKRSPLS